MQDLESHELQKRLIIGTVTADNPYDVILFDWVSEKLYRYLVLNFKNIEEILLHNIEHPINAEKYGVNFTGFYSSYEYKDSIPSADIKKIYWKMQLR